MNYFSKLLAVVVSVLFTVTLNAQTKEIRGTVTDSDGNPVIAAGVQVVEVPEIIVVTDMDGKYVISIPSNKVSEAKTLEFSFLGTIVIAVFIHRLFRDGQSIASCASETMLCWMNTIYYTQKTMIHKFDFLHTD